MYDVIHYLREGENVSVCGTGKAYNGNCLHDPHRTTCQKCQKNAYYLQALEKPIVPIPDWTHHYAPVEGWYWVITACDAKSIAYSDGSAWLTNDYEEEDWENYNQAIDKYLYIEEPPSPRR